MFRILEKSRRIRWKEKSFVGDLEKKEQDRGRRSIGQWVVAMEEDEKMRGNKSEKCHIIF